MSTSPSEFLTFYRRIATSSALRRGVTARPVAVRQFNSSSIRLSSGGKLSTDSSTKTDAFPDDQHTTNKKDGLDVQNEYSGKGKQAKGQDEGGAATEEKDPQSSTSRAKKDHPEAPDVVIGMQDERGGKGMQ